MSLADQAHFNDYWPPDFAWGSRDPRNHADLIQPFEHSGVQFEGGVHVDFAPQLRAFLDELVPHIPGGLHAPCGSYNPDSVSADGTRSFHTWGIAADLNWKWNPMGVAHRPTGKFALPAVTGTIARKYGMEWGGDWTSPKDWMHVESHLTPSLARTVRSTDELTLTPEDEATIAAMIDARADQLERNLTGAILAVLTGQEHGPLLTRSAHPVLLDGEGIAGRLRAIKAEITE